MNTTSPVQNQESSVQSTGVTNPQERAALVANKAAIIHAIESSLRERLGSFGLRPGAKKALEVEASFLSGAMCALQVLMPPDEEDKISPLIPPRWVFSALRGVSVLDHE